MLPEPQAVSHMVCLQSFYEVRVSELPVGQQRPDALSSHNLDDALHDLDLLDEAGDVGSGQE